MIHSAECRIDLNAGLHLKPIKVVQGAVDMTFSVSQGAQSAAPAPAQIIIKGSPENQAKVLNLLGMFNDADSELASMLRESHPELATDEKGSAATVRKMILEELMEMRD